MKPYIVIFSSSASYNIAEEIYSELKDLFVVHLWKGEFFGENKTTPLWTFFKKLFYYDYAILVLSNDSMILENDGPGSGETKKWIPKDNVIFELGATMSRLGPQKTIMIVPDDPKIHLPGYFDDVQPYVFTYHAQKNTENEDGRMRNAINSIKSILGGVTFETFHSELPAQGLAYAYLHNFILPVYNTDSTQLLIIDGKEQSWDPKTGMTITIVIPEEIMGRAKAGEFFKNEGKYYKTSFKVKDGRDLGIYVLPRKTENDPLHILDIPTTLLTAENIIERIEHFWRGKDNKKILERDLRFINELKHREIVNFERVLNNIFQSEYQNVYIISISELPEHIKMFH
jgi:hypothetical protein